MCGSPTSLDKRRSSSTNKRQFHSSDNLYALGVGGGNGVDDEVSSSSSSSPPPFPTMVSSHHHHHHPPQQGAVVVEAFSHHQYSLSWKQRHGKRLAATMCFFMFLTIVTSNENSHYHRTSSHRHHHHPKLRGTAKFVSNILHRGGGGGGGSSSIGRQQQCYEYHFGGAVRPGYFFSDDAIGGNNNNGDEEFLFAAITDQDRLSSSSSSSSSSRYRSVLLPGRLLKKRQPSSSSSSSSSSQYYYEIDFQKERELWTGHNEEGRGGEYSDLRLFDDRLLTFDDRTGEVVEILNSPNGQSSTVVPRFVFTEEHRGGEEEERQIQEQNKNEGIILNDGPSHSYYSSDKGMKWEWATVKDGELYIGSIGKELVNDDLTFKSEAGMWIVVMNDLGQSRRVDWSAEYNFVRLQLFADLPGYVAHEAVNWSHHLQKWVFLPRRISQQPYSPKDDERLGSNKVLLVDEEFTTSTTVEINFQRYKDQDGGLHGFSSFAFVPNTKDRHVLATRSVEEGCYSKSKKSQEGDDEDEDKKKDDEQQDCKLRTYFCVFDIVTGEVLMDEVLYDGPLKFEGIEFVNLSKIPPPTL